jgi:hypothetical protein
MLKYGRFKAAAKYCAATFIIYDIDADPFQKNL